MLLLHGGGGTFRMILEEMGFTGFGWLSPNN